MFDKLTETTKQNVEHFVSRFQKQVDHTFQFVKNETDRQLQNQLNRSRFYQESMIQDVQHIWETAQDLQRQATERVLEDVRRLRDVCMPLFDRGQKKGEVK